MQAPARSSSIARARAWASPAPRSIGICPMPSRTGPSPFTSHSVDFASALIWRRRIAATPTITGSQWLSWLPTTSSGPDSGKTSSPSTCSRPHTAAGRVTAIAILYMRLGSFTERGRLEGVMP